MKYLKRIIYLTIFIIFILCIKVNAVVITIDPGHGGVDPGSINNEARIIERDVNLKIATYLKTYLEEYENVTVFMTHTGFSSGKLDLLDRALVARRNNSDLFISIHCNATSTSSTVNGAEAFVSANTSLPKYNQECTKIANLILDNISKLGIKKIGVKTRLSSQADEVYSDGTRGDYYGVIRYAMKGIKEGPGANIQNGEGISTVLVEHCYIQNGDEKYINNEQGIKNLAKADCDAIVEYFGLKLKGKNVKSIKLDKDELTMLLGEKSTLKADINPSTAENKKITWSSSNENVATVKDGIVSAIAVGNTTITVKTDDGGYTSSCNITVKNYEIETNIKEINLLETYNSKIIYDIKPTIPDGYAVNIESLDNNIALIDKNNIVTANSEGNTGIIIKIIDSNKKEINEKKIPIKVSKLKENEFININKYKQKNSIITEIDERTTKENFIKNISLSDNFAIEISNNNEYVGTETKIVIKRKAYTIKEDVEVTSEKEYKEIQIPEEIIMEFFCVLYGDVNGDGKISALDYTLIKNHIMDVKKIQEGNIKEAADVNGDGKVSTLDYTLIKNHIMDVKKIVAR